MIKGIDISHWNGAIDFNKVKKSGVDFVIIKAGGSDKSPYKDSMFEKYYKAAKEAGLKVGAYYFVGKKFLGKESGLADAKRFIEILKGKQFDYPVFLDLETTETRYKKEATEASKAFCRALEDAGYFVGIYASDISGFKEKLELSEITQYSLWVARYGSEPVYVNSWGMWQYSSKGSVNGICGSVDLDYSKIDFSDTIIKKGFNGYKKPAKKKAEVK